MKTWQASIPLVSALCVLAQQGALAQERADFSKRRIETPLERIIRTPKDSGGLRQLPVLRTEAFGPARPARAASSRSNAPAVTASAVATARIARASRSAVAVKPSDNPKVQPGLVEWNTDFETACAQSRKSGKPVLLFHMMGNLDDRFC